MAARTTVKKAVLVVTRVERFELPNAGIAQWAAGMIEDKGEEWTESGWSMHDAGNFLGHEVTATVEEKRCSS